MRRTPVLAALLATLGALVYSTAWSIASPMGSSPDEAAHVVYSWAVSSGQTLPGNEELVPRDRGPAWTRATVPGELLEFNTCFTFDVTRSADCPAHPRGEEVRTTTYHTRYPPPYYLAQGAGMHAGLALGLDGDTVLLLGRIGSGAVSVGLVVLAAAVLARRFDPLAGIAVLVAGLTPTGLSLFAAINPNGIELAAAMCAAAFVVAARHDHERAGSTSRWLRAGILLSFVMLTWARPLSFVWAGLLFLVLVAPTGPPRTWLAQVWRRPGRATVALLVVNFVLALAWLVYEFGTRAVTSVVETDGWSSLPVVAKVTIIVLKLGDVLVQMVAAMGWDVVLPSFFSMGWVIAAGALLWAGLARPGTRGRMLLPVAFLGASALVMMTYSMLTGFGWQGRYLLPPVAAFVVLCVPVVAGLRADGRRPRLVPAVLGVFVALQSAAFVWYMWRYVYGIHVWYTRFDAAPLPVVPPGWGPIGGQKAAVGLYVLGVVLLGAAGTLLVRARRAVAEDGTRASAPVSAAR